MRERVRDAGTIGRASDFFGPGVRRSTVGERVFGAAVQHKSAQVLGDPDQPHTYTFVADFARARRPGPAGRSARGRVARAQRSTISTRQFVEVSAAQAGYQVGIQRTPGWIVRALGVVNPRLRAVAEQLYQSEHSFVVDHSKFARTFDLAPTPHAEGIRRTLDWYRSLFARN
jgi:nucleoside-diphosphate-sugar epimerase